MPTEAQHLAAAIRAAREVYERKHRKPYMGGYLIPNNETCYKYLARKFGMTQAEIRLYFTYSRNGSCTHKWSEGACPDCQTPSALSK